MDYGPIPGWAILAIIGAVSISFFAYQVWKATRLVMLGKPDNRFDNWPARIKEVATGWLGQKKVLRRQNCWWHSRPNVLGLFDAVNRHV